MSKPSLTLRRLRPGLYETPDGDWRVIRGEGDCGWSGMWCYLSHKFDVYSDPMPTLAIARTSLAIAVEDRRAAK